MSNQKLVIQKLTHFFLLNGNGRTISQSQLHNTVLVYEHLKDELTHKTFTSYKNIIQQFLGWCLKEKASYQMPQNVVKYLKNKIEEHRWSTSYCRLILTVLNKYVLYEIPEMDKPKYIDIKKHVYKIITNKFDLQSYNDEQLVIIFEYLLTKSNVDDLLLLIIIMAGCGLRFIETRQIT